MESMLHTTSTRMTGLDLGSSSSSNSSTSPRNNNLHHNHHGLTASNASKRSSSSSSEEMLTTPKFAPESAGLAMMLSSPRGFPSVVAPKGSVQVTPGPAHQAQRSPRPLVNGTSEPEDMLVTPVLTTPKTSDLWPSLSSARPPQPGETIPLTSFSPENLSVTSPGSMAENAKPPKDLPMESDIGLKSPHDGLLAKRRREFRGQHASSTNSDNSGNSCDTLPTSSQNSPRDLTTKNNAEESSSSASKVQVKLEFEDATSSTSSSTNSKTTTTSSISKIPNSPLGFKHPKSAFGGGGPPSELPSHYTPSPLAVPSPNWSAVENYFGSDMLKTPKLLDNNVFDFLTPTTPRSKQLRGGDRSPVHDSDRYSGRDQRLSPRLSPRFPIPVEPTDLSSKGNSNSNSSSSNGNAEANSNARVPPVNGLGDPPPYPAEAEDLSISSSNRQQQQQQQQQPQVKSSPPSASNSPPHPPQPVLPVLKQEYLAPSPQSGVNAGPVVDHLRSRTPSGHSTGGNGHQQHQQDVIKTEIDEYEYRHASLQHHPPPPHPSVHHAPPPPGFPPYFHHQLHHFNALYQQQQQQQRGGSGGGVIYQDGIGGAVIRPPPPGGRLTASPSDMPYEPPPGIPYAPAAGWPPGDRPNSSQGWAPEPPPPHDDSSMSPPPPPTAGLYHLHQSPAGKGTIPVISVKPPHALSASPGPPGEMRRGPKKSRRPSGGSDIGTPNGEPKKKGKKAKAVKDPGGPKRVYTCPHCQRSYDWNYNLNRHLKYECGKENAFQCAKCGRKFPHKQNCVYHLKRKHKVVCDTIDQYMSAGLVLFRGATGPAGQIAKANPAEPGSVSPNAQMVS